MKGVFIGKHQHISTYILNHWGFLGGLVAEDEKLGKRDIYISIWLVVWNHGMLNDFPETVGNGKLSQLTKSFFKEG